MFKMGESLIKGMKPEADLSFEKILNNLLDGGQNLALKTEIHNPKDLTSLQMQGEFLTQVNMRKSGKNIKKWIDIYLANMVSYKRQSREEVSHVLASLREENAGKGEFTKNIL